MFQIPRLQKWLSTAHPAVFSAWAIVAAFSTYFSMYAFRQEARPTKL